MADNIDLQKMVERLNQVGIALSGERNLNRLLEMIVDNARDFTNADGGTLHLVQEKDLKFEILQNDTLNTRMGGTSGQEITWPPVPLYIEGKPNESHVSANVANTGEAVNIPDVYEAEGFDFTGTRNFDQSSGYRSKSMLVMPMRNHEDDIIGVLQLLNAKNPDTEELVPFSSDLEDLISSLASQAAVAITNAELIQELMNLFDAFIRSIATAIDEKSAYTAGHISRVAELTMAIAQRVNDVKDGPYQNVHFTPDQMNELRVAAWMHDVGKITTPEYVVDKATKLATIFDRVEMVKTRYEILKRDLEIKALKAKLDLVLKGKKDPDELKKSGRDLKRRLRETQEEIDFILECNKVAEFMEEENIQKLETIAKKTYKSNGKREHLLTEDELHNLSIRGFGTLTDEERKIIENHAPVSIKMLSQLPFPKKLKNVTEYAGGHHERLDGTGYPLGLTAEQLPLEARIIAVADVFEALTAGDRPYKKAKKLSEAMRIIGFMVKDNHIDKDLVELSLKEHVFQEYAKNEMDPSQVDDIEV